MEEIMATPKNELEKAVRGSNIQNIATFDVTTEEGFAKAFNAGIAGDEKVEDHIGEQVVITGIVVERVETENEQTGELEYMPHVVFFTEDGTSYEGFSNGLYSSASRLLNALHNAGRVLDEEHPIRIEFAERKARLGRMHYFKIVPAA